MRSAPGTRGLDLGSAAWFVPRLQIIGRTGRVQRLAPLEPEQGKFVRAWGDGRRKICVLKPRQIGQTTITQACIFHAAYVSPDPIGILTLGHESGACARVNQMHRQFVRGLPGPLRPPLAKDNANEIVLGHNGAVLRQVMAGGRGQARSFTYQMLVATEMAFWPRGSASVAGTDVDRDVWASALSTLHHGPHTRIVVESTGNGPSGVFYDIVRTARESKEWLFLFYPWHSFASYTIEPPEGYAPTPEERELLQLYGLTPGQLAWRRQKLVDEGISERRFRCEYPFTWEDPFLLTESSWFDAELLNRVLARVPHAWRRNSLDGPLRVYHRPEPGRRYFAGFDTSGGTGRDDAALVILRDDLEVVLAWSDNRSPPHMQADTATSLCGTYNALVLTEENNYGRQVIARMEYLGAKTWKDDKAKNFISLGGRAGQSKKMVYGFARHLINDAVACSADAKLPARINDEDLLAQLLVVREDEAGAIEAPAGRHDDLADAYVFALWCGRHHFAPAPTPQEPERVRMGQIRTLLGATGR